MTNDVQFPNPPIQGSFQGAHADVPPVPQQQAPAAGTQSWSTQPRETPGLQSGYAPGPVPGCTMATQYASSAQYGSAAQEAPTVQRPPQYRPAPVPATHASQWLPLPSCTFAEAVKRFFVGYVRFDSRSSRREFWYSYLFVMMVSATLAFTTITTLPAIATLWSAATAIPMLAVGARRLHDSGRSAVPLAVNTVLTMVSAVASVVSGILFMAVALTFTKGPENSPFDELTLDLLMGIFAVSAITAIAMFVWYVWMMTRPSDPAATRWDR